jgi:hypothetical protein
VAALIVTLPSPAQAALTTRASWNMDALPTMVDSAGGDNNGTTRNITSGGAGLYKFNGTSSTATVPDKDNLDPGTATIKLTARVSFTSTPRTGGTYDIVRKGLSTSAGGDYKMEIRRNSSGSAIAACTFIDSGRVQGDVSGSVNLAGKGFQVITCTKTATSVQLVAGGQTRTISKRLGTIRNSASVSVGSKGDGTDFFPGVMDYVRIQIG